MVYMHLLLIYQYGRGLDAIHYIFENYKTNGVHVNIYIIVTI